jgi:cullin 1
MAQPLNAEQKMDILRAGFDSTFTNFTDKDHISMTRAHYMTLTQYVMELCSSPAVQQTSNRTGQSQSSGAHVGGNSLYMDICDFLERICSEICKECEMLQGEELLAKFTQKWETYRVSSQVLDHLCNYVNCYYVKRARDDGDREKYRIYELALVIWRDHVFIPINSEGKDHITMAILDMIRKERNGEVINTLLIVAAKDCLVQIGLKHDESGDKVVGGLQIYVDHFESKFISCTLSFYEAESKAFLDENNVIEYLKKVDARLAEEAKRVNLYLHCDTKEELDRVCDKAMIIDHLPALHGEFKTLLNDDRLTDLKRLFATLKRVEDGLLPLRTILETHVYAQGMSRIDATAAAGDLEDHRSYVDTLLAVHNKFSNLVAQAFDNEASLVASLDKACRKFINDNAFTKGKPARSPELLAKCCDSLLKTSSKNPEYEELEKTLNDIMVVFKFLDDKDVFLKFYSKLFSKRLVTATSASEDSESQMISKLKQVCGNDYISKLQKMFGDKGISKDLSSKFKEFLEQMPAASQLGVDFNVMVLTHTAWPVSQVQDHNLPVELARCVELFSSFYAKQHQGRKLTWHYGQSKGELRTNYTHRPYFLTSSTIQMAILLLYNDQLSFSIADLLPIFGCKEDFLLANMDLLVKVKMLEFKDDMYHLNEKVKYKKLRTKIDQPIKAEQKAESDETHKAVEEDRKMSVQACIVRIMKMRKRLKHMLLINEAIDQLKPRFKPEIPLIKRCIDIMIEKEYIKRADGSRDEYEYLA